MRTQEELNSPEFRDDLLPFYQLLKRKKISCEMRRHLGAEPNIKELIGYFPTGEHQILIKKDEAEYSVIRGYISSGMYEIMKVKGKEGKFVDPERFETAEELISSLLTP